MNYKIGLWAMIFFFLSCNSKLKEDKHLIMKQKSADYEICISSIATKINNKGEAQCSKYAETTISDTAYVSYGLKLKEVLAMTYNTMPKYVEKLPFDSLNNCYLDIHIKNNTEHKLNYDSILSLAISDVFRFKVIAVDSLVKGYELTVKDVEKLKAYQDKCNGSSAAYKKGVWVTSSYTLGRVAKILDRYSDSFISFSAPDENCYSIEFIVGNDSEKINKKLETFGLMLKEKEFYKSFYNVSVR